MSLSVHRMTNVKVEGNIRSLQSRRDRLEAIFDLLRAITEEQTRNGRISPTRVQHLANMSYDKMTRYLKEMENFGFISNKSGIKITDKGGNYLGCYHKAIRLINRLDKKYSTK